MNEDSYKGLSQDIRNHDTFSHTVTAYNRYRIPFKSREKAAYLILRKKGLSINMIGRLFARSTSVIQRALTSQSAQAFNHNFTVFHKRMDLRKLPNVTRRRISAKLWRKARNLEIAWLSWILGQGEKPP